MRKELNCRGGTKYKIQTKLPQNPGSERVLIAGKLIYSGWLRKQAQGVVRVAITVGIFADANKISTCY